MIKGIGIDIVNVNRFRKKPYTKNKTFYNKIFSDSEIKYCLSKKDPYIHFSGKFAAKESLIKALGIKIELKNIIIVNQNDGSVKVKSNLFSNKVVLVSISHEKDYAIALAFVEKTIK